MNVDTVDITELTELECAEILLGLPMKVQMERFVERSMERVRLAASQGHKIEISWEVRAGGQHRISFEWWDGNS